jgi:AcrR family transcriptional regulator
MRSTTTEEKIKDAARKIFTLKGYAATRTRDIAAEAGVNVALINYHFRSKSNLFEVISLESMLCFRESLMGILNDEKIALEEKLAMLANNFIDLFTGQPNLPLFMLNTLQQNPEKFISTLASPLAVEKTVVYKQISKALKKKGCKDLNPIHVMINLLSLSIFPFIIGPWIRFRSSMTRHEYNVLMQERKALIPHWIDEMLNA